MSEIQPATREDVLPVLDDLTLDVARGCLMRAGQPIHLRPQSYAVLAYLVEQRGRLVSKDWLVEKVWGGRAVTDGSVGKCIEEVRDALGADARVYLRNVRGRGYIFDPPTAPRTAEPAVSDAIDSPTGAAGQLPHARRCSRLVIPIAALMVAAAWFAGSRYFGARPPAITSIAVLPFVNASGHADLDYLCDGIAENLIDRLSRLSGVKVIAASSSFQYRARPIDSREVGRSLGAQAIVVGQLAERSDTVRVSIELVNASDRTFRWRGEFTHLRANLQQLPEDAARTIAMAVGRALEHDRARAVHAA